MLIRCSLHTIYSCLKCKQPVPWRPPPPPLHHTHWDYNRRSTNQRGGGAKYCQAKYVYTENAWVTTNQRDMSKLLMNTAKTSHHSWNLLIHKEEMGVFLNRAETSRSHSMTQATTVFLSACFIRLPLYVGLSANQAEEEEEVRLSAAVKNVIFSFRWEERIYCTELWSFCCIKVCPSLRLNKQHEPLCRQLVTQGRVWGLTGINRP